MDQRPSHALRAFQFKAPTEPSLASVSWTYWPPLVLEIRRRNSAERFENLESDLVGRIRSLGTPS